MRAFLSPGDAGEKDPLGEGEGAAESAKAGTASGYGDKKALKAFQML